ncbi:MAG TPA: DUF6249 domain-containing protein [Thermoanaerobaculia bacterium]|jgi:hypothetical protein|nr:DUF6249 domain-containing protein [Thermoanaerobaculia bacterium]
MQILFNALSELLTLMIPIVALIGGFTFLTFWIITHQRRREREAYYRYELGKKAVEKGYVPEDKLLDLLDNERRNQWLGRREGARLAGLILIALGIGLIIALGNLDDHLTGLGAVPMFLGLALFVYGLFFAPKDVKPEPARVSAASAEPSASA